MEKDKILDYYELTNCCNCAAPINHNIGKCEYCGTFFRAKQNTYQGPTYDKIPATNNISFGINAYTATAYYCSPILSC